MDIKSRASFKLQDTLIYVLIWLYYSNTFYIFTPTINNFSSVNRNNNKDSYVLLIEKKQRKTKRKGMHSIQVGKLNESIKKTDILSFGSVKYMVKCIDFNTIYISFENTTV